MISLYADEDVDILIKPLLQAKGFKVLTTNEERMLAKSDREQLEHAIKLHCSFFTHNRVDFENLAKKFLEENIPHSGIILATRRNIYELARRTARFLESQTAETIKNRLWYI